MVGMITCSIFIIIIIKSSLLHLVIFQTKIFHFNPNNGYSRWRGSKKKKKKIQSMDWTVLVQMCGVIT